MLQEWHAIVAILRNFAAKKRHGNVEVIPDIKYDENGIFDFVNILKNDESDSNQERIQYLTTLIPSVFISC